MFVAVFEGLIDGVVLGVRKTLDEAKALCREAHKRAKAYVKGEVKSGKLVQAAVSHAGFAAVGEAGKIRGQFEVGGTYHHTAVVTLDEKGDPVKRQVVTKGFDL